MDFDMIIIVDMMQNSMVEMYVLGLELIEFIGRSKLSILSHCHILDLKIFLHSRFYEYFEN